MMNPELRDELIKFFREEIESTGSGVILDRPVEPGGRRDRLIPLYRETLRCTGCPLAESRRKVVFGGGNADSHLLFVGEAPGRDEDLSGLPFVGRAGVLLDRVFAELDIRRDRDCFITNILKCRPPGNRDPLPSEITRCLPTLEKQLSILEPWFIITLGRVAAGVLLGGSPKMGDIRGKLFSYHGIPLVATYHPAALLRNDQLLPVFRGDLRYAVGLFRKISRGMTWGPSVSRKTGEKGKGS